MVKKYGKKPTGRVLPASEIRQRNRARRENHWSPRGPIPLLCHKYIKDLGRVPDESDSVDRMVGYLSQLLGCVSMFVCRFDGFHGHLIFPGIDEPQEKMLGPFSDPDDAWFAIIKFLDEKIIAVMGNLRAMGKDGYQIQVALMSTDGGLLWVERAWEAGAIEIPESDVVVGR